MKNMRKLLAVVLAVMMVMAMATTAFATSITIENGASGSEYAAYRLLNAELPTEDDTSGTYNFTVNEKYLTALQEVTGKTSSDDIVAYIDALTSADAVRAFADAVYAKINAMAADYTADDNKFESVEMGYYLIAETKLGDKSDTYSLIMLDTAAANDDENITVSTKEDQPTVDKEVQEVNDSTGATSWGESADHDIGDIINYRITGTVSSKYADYKSYYYSFGDTMAAGLTLNTDSIKIMIGDVDVTSQFDIDTTEHSFTATANLKELTGVTITGDTKIIVTYTATLNENAVSGATGNKNEVVLKYENDPYHEGDGEPETPGETPKDINIVFTYDAIVNKTDEDGNALEGAGFTLYKWVADEESEAGGAWVQIGDEISGNTTFTFEGLDVGKYKLEETTVPNGYNKADDIIFEVVATYNETTDPVTLTGLEVKDENGNVISGAELTFTANTATGEVTTDVVNKAGVALPETGGMGTTMFYVFGAILMIGAAVLLVTKRRMNMAE